MREWGSEKMGCLLLPIAPDPVWVIILISVISIVIFTQLTRTDSFMKKLWSLRFMVRL